MHTGKEKNDVMDEIETKKQQRIREYSDIRRQQNCK